MEQRPAPRRRLARHQIPTHLDVPDKILSVWGVGITVRQLLVLLSGWSAVANAWVRLGWLVGLGTPGVVLHLALAAVPAALALLVAFKQVAGRPLEVWLLVLLRYWLQPKVYLWRSVRGERPLADFPEDESRQAGVGAGEREGLDDLWSEEGSE